MSSRQLSSQGNVAHLVPGGLPSQSKWQKKPSWEEPCGSLPQPCFLAELVGQAISSTLCLQCKNKGVGLDSFFPTIDIYQQLLYSKDHIGPHQ